MARKGKWVHGGGYVTGDQSQWVKKTPSVRDVRMGNAYVGGDSVRVRDSRTGHYVGEVSSSPRQTAQIVKQAKADGRHVFVEKVKEVDVVEYSTTGCLILSTCSVLMMGGMLWMIRKMK